jgi:hypothetical protein
MDLQVHVADRPTIVEAATEVDCPERHAVVVDVLAHKGSVMDSVFLLGAPFEQPNAVARPDREVLSFRVPDHTRSSGIGA